MSFFAHFLEDLKTPLYKNAIFLLSNQIIVNGLGFFFWMVVAWGYAASEVGIAAAIIPIMTLIGMLSGLGFGIGLVRFLPSSGKKSRAMINSSFTIAGLAAILVAFVFLIGLDIWAPDLVFIRESLPLLLSFVLFSIVFALYPMMNWVFIGRRKAEFVLVGSSITGLKILLAAVLVSLFGAFGIFASWSLAMLVALVVGVLFLIPRANPGYKPVPTIKKSVVGDMLHYSAGNYVALVFGLVPTSIPPLIVLNLLTAADVAYFRIAFTIAGLLFAVVYGIAPSLFAEGSHFVEDLGRDVRKALKFVFALLVPGIIIVLIFGKYFLLLFGSEYSSQGLLLLQIFALSSIFVAINRIYTTTRRVLKKLKPIIAIGVFNAFAVVGFGYAFLLSVGLVGIAIAWILSHGIVSAAIGIHILVERKREKDVKKKKTIGRNEGDLMPKSG